jgi:NAD(P)-dependent dehydrogenase (short-subunit alcohol dehydrogenase family)
MVTDKQAGAGRGHLQDLSLDGKVALVTGSGTGLGRDMAIALGAAGAELILVARRQELLEETKSLIPTHAEVVVADLRDQGAMDSLGNFVSRVDILVNNAGIAIKTEWLSQTLDDLREIMEVNVYAPYRLSQLLSPGMVERGWGRIINVASIYGSLGVDVRRYPSGFDVPGYVASKHALIGLTHYLGCRLADTGVTVNALSPGMFPNTGQNTDISSDELSHTLANATPMRRVGGTNDLGAAVVFLASPGSRFVTGQNLIVDGGWSVW